jgi:hypothetical protein
VAQGRSIYLYNKWRRVQAKAPLKGEGKHKEAGWEEQCERGRKGKHKSGRRGGAILNGLLLLGASLFLPFRLYLVVIWLKEETSADQNPS